VHVTYVGDWHTHPLFIAANARNTIDAIQRLPGRLRARTQLIFTAHSIPSSMAERYPYQAQFEATARLIADAVAAEAPELAPPLRHATVYQSRSGRPEDPWLGPDICDYLREQRARGLEAAVVVPAGFVCDHVEVLYDLDVEAADVCREIGLPMVRAQAVNDHPAFIEMMADVVMGVCRQYEGGRPLELVPA
jgi:ferrochelatase